MKLHLPKQLFSALIAAITLGTSVAHAAYTWIGDVSEANPSGWAYSTNWEFSGNSIWISKGSGPGTPLSEMWDEIIIDGGESGVSFGSETSLSGITLEGWNPRYSLNNAKLYTAMKKWQTNTPGIINLAHGSVLDLSMGNNGNFAGEGILTLSGGSELIFRMQRKDPSAQFTINTWDKNSSVQFLNNYQNPESNNNKITYSGKLTVNAHYIKEAVVSNDAAWGECYLGLTVGDNINLTKNPIFNLDLDANEWTKLDDGTSITQENCAEFANKYCIIKDTSTGDYKVVFSTYADNAKLTWSGSDIVWGKETQFDNNTPYSDGADVIFNSKAANVALKENIGARKITIAEGAGIRLTSDSASTLTLTLGAVLYGTLQLNEVHISNNNASLYVKDGGVLNILSGSVVDLTTCGGTSNVNGGKVTTLITNGGFTNVNGGTVSNLTTVAGTTNITSGTVATLNANGGFTNVNGGTVSNLTTAAGTTNITNGTVTTLTSKGGFTNVNGGQIQTLVIKEGGTTNVTGGSLGEIDFQSNGSLNFNLTPGKKDSNYSFETISSTSSDNYNRNITISSGVTVTGASINNAWGMGTITVDGVLNLSEEIIFSTGSNDSDQNNVLTGSGVINTPKLTFGNIGTYNFNGVTLNVGSGGITHDTKPNAAFNINLGAMILGASADWTSNVSQINLTAEAGSATTVNTNGFTITLNTKLAGSGALNKMGAGTLILKQENTYSGGTTISDGVLQATHSSALGSGGVTIDGGTLDVAVAGMIINELNYISGALIHNGLTVNEVNFSGNTLKNNGSLTLNGSVNVTDIHNLDSTSKEKYSDGDNGFASGTFVVISGGTIGGTFGVSYNGQTLSKDSTSSNYYTISDSSDKLTVTLDDKSIYYINKGKVTASADIFGAASFSHYHVSSEGTLVASKDNLSSLLTNDKTTGNGRIQLTDGTAKLANNIKTTFSGVLELTGANTKVQIGGAPGDTVNISTLGAIEINDDAQLYYWANPSLETDIQKISVVQGTGNFYFHDSNGAALYINEISIANKASLNVTSNWYDSATTINTLSGSGTLVVNNPQGNSNANIIINSLADFSGNLKFSKNSDYALNVTVNTGTAGADFSSITLAGSPNFIFNVQGDTKIGALNIGSNGTVNVDAGKTLTLGTITESENTSPNTSKSAAIELDITGGENSKLELSLKQATSNWGWGYNNTVKLTGDFNNGIVRIESGCLANTVYGVQNQEDYGSYAITNLGGAALHMADGTTLILRKNNSAESFGAGDITLEGTTTLELYGSCIFANDTAITNNIFGGTLKFKDTGTVTLTGQMLDLQVLDFSGKTNNKIVVLGDGDNKVITTATFTKVSAGNSGTATLQLNSDATLNCITTTEGTIILTGSGVYDLGSNSTTSNVSGLTSPGWTGTVKISGGSADGKTSWGTFSELGNTNSWISLSGVQGHLSADKEISNNLILETGTALNIMQGSSDTSIEKYNKFTGSIKGDGEFKFSGWDARGGKYGYYFSGDTSEWTGQFNNASPTAYDVNVYFEQSGTETAPAQIFKAVASDTTIGVVNTSSTNKLNVHIGKSDASDAVVQFNGIISGVDKLTVNNRASFERSVTVATVEVAQKATATINDKLTAASVQLGTAATITKVEGKEATTMSKVQMNSTGISGTTTDGTSSISNALIDLQNATKFSISDMTLSNVSLKAADAGTELSLNNVDAQEVELTSGQFTLGGEVALKEQTSAAKSGGYTASFSSDQLSGITLNNAGGASLTVDLGSLPESLTMGQTYDELTITLYGFTMDYESGKGLIFAEDSWLAQMLDKEANKGAVVSIQSLNEATAATQEAAVASTNAVTYNSAPGSNVGTVICITGLSVIPEPATTTLGLVALAALVTRRRRK